VKSLLSLLKYFVKYKRFLIVGFIFILLSNTFAILIPPIVRESIDGILLVLKNDKLPEYIQLLPNKLRSLPGLAIISGALVLLSAILKGVCMYFMRMSIIVMSRYIEYDQKNDIFRHYQGLGQDFFAINYTGDLMNRISDDVSKVRMFTGPAVMYSLNLTCMIIMVVSLMFYINAQITLYVIMPLPILAFTIYIVSDTMNKKSDIIQQRLSYITSFVQETFSGIQVVKSYSVEDNFISEFDTLNTQYKNENMELVKVNGVFMPLVLALIGLSILITIYIGGNAVVNGEFTLGNIVEYVIYVNMLTWPVASLGYVTSLVQRGAASQRRINEFMNVKMVDNLGKRSLSKLSHSIEFKDVWFRYSQSSDWVLKDVNFTISSHSTFGILGTTGSGKSTIAKLLVGVYRPTKGKILIDGIPIEEFDRSSLSGIFGYVSQDIFLFSDTIRNNILFGADNLKSESVLINAIKCAKLDGEISSFPDGIETILGERGITLSGGQKQRVAIARAIIKKPSVLLIDNGLSAVDTITEAAIKNNIKAWNKSQTQINISHRVSSVQDCNSILLLDQGSVVEFGDHDKLIKKNGMYSKLHKKQNK